MLINCPKCGFSQPQDKYCAQCGVDMETFRPAQVSLLKRIISHPGIQFLVLLLCLVGALQVFYFRDQKQLNERISLLKGTMQLSSADQSSLSLEEASQTQEDSEALDKSLPLSSTSSLSGTKEAESMNSAVEPPTHQAKEKFLILTFYEIPKAGLLKLFEESQNEGHFEEFKEYATGLTQNFKSKLTLFQAKELTSQKIVLNQNTGTFFTGLKDESTMNIGIGLQGYFLIQKMSPRLTRLSIEILRSWREPSENESFAIKNREFPLQVELEKNMDVFLAGLIPRNANLSDQDDLLVSIPTFKILNSADFINGLSEFVLVIELSEQ